MWEYFEKITICLIGLAVIAVTMTKVTGCQEHQDEMKVKIQEQITQCQKVNQSKSAVEIETLCKSDVHF